VDNLAPDDPREIGRYRVLKRLGRGGMGTVYLGTDATGQRVAIKVINPEYSRHEQFRMRFRREADAARRVRRFCTAAVLDAALDGEQLYVVTEYVEGPNLEEAVARSGPLRGSSLDALAVGVATALTAIHGAGVVHRDLKPSNVLLSPVGPRVIDFGIARALDTLGGITGTGEIVGTPRYMSPEVLRGEAVTPACDVFSWGCLVAFAASGRPPFGGDTLPAVLYQVLNVEPVLEGLEPALEQLVRYALSKDPAQRPTAQQLLDSMVGRAAPPERTAVSVQNAWQEAAPLGPAPAPRRDPGATLYDPAPPGAPAAPPGTMPYPDPASTVPAGHPSPGQAPAPSPTLVAPDQTLSASGRASSGSRARLAVVAAVLLVLLGGGGAGLWLLLSPDGPPEGLDLLYQDDFTSDDTGWDGTYDDEQSGDDRGYAPDGYYAIDVNGEDEVYRATAPLPFTPQPPTQSPDPSATPTPITPNRLVMAVDMSVREGTSGNGEFGLFCRGADTYEATRYEFLLDTTGQARIRKVQNNAGGDLARTAVDYRPEPGLVKRVHAECTGTDDGVTLTMWVDGDRVLTTKDTTPLPNGHVGLLARVGAKSSAVLKASFDNYTVHGPRPAAGDANGT